MSCVSLNGSASVSLNDNSNVAKYNGSVFNVFGDNNYSNQDNISAEAIRDALAARSNSLLSIYNGRSCSSNNISNIIIETAYKLYNDWDTPDELGLIRSRGGIPHIYHAIVGKWVPTHSKFDNLADLTHWLNKYATNSSRAREDYYSAWKDMPRGLRIINPYSYYPKPELVYDNKGDRSIIIKNFNNNMSEADIGLILSVYGPIIDIYRPTHKKRDTYMSEEARTKCKKAFYLFVEFANAASVTNIINDLGKQEIYFMNYPISISVAKERNRSFVNSTSSSE